MNKKRSEKAVYYTLSQVVLLYLGNCKESGAEKKKPFSQFVHCVWSV